MAIIDSPVDSSKSWPSHKGHSLAKVRSTKAVVSCSCVLYKPGPGLTFLLLLLLLLLEDEDATEKEEDKDEDVDGDPYCLKAEADFLGVGIVKAGGRKVGGRSLEDALE